MADEAIRVVGLREFRQKMGQLIQERPTRMRQGLTAASEAARKFMVTKYLSGQRVRRVTGTLVRGWHTVYVPSDDPRAVLGTKVFYTPYLEYGVMGAQKVRARRVTQTVRSRKTGELVKEKRLRSGYTRFMKLRPRRFVRDTLIYARPEILEALAQAVSVKAGGARGS